MNNRPRNTTQSSKGMIPDDSGFPSHMPDREFPPFASSGVRGLSNPGVLGGGERAHSGDELVELKNLIDRITLEMEPYLECSNSRALAQQQQSTAPQQNHTVKSAAAKAKVSGESCSPQRTSGHHRQRRKTEKLPEKLQMRMVKTKFCRWVSKGKCERGDSCFFAHSESELRSIPDLRLTRLCVKFEKTGKCTAGKNCRFAHSDAELRCFDEVIEDEKYVAVGENVLCSDFSVKSSENARNSSAISSSLSDFRPDAEERHHSVGSRKSPSAKSEASFHAKACTPDQSLNTKPQSSRNDTATTTQTNVLENLTFESPTPPTSSSTRRDDLRTSYTSQHDWSRGRQQLPPIKYGHQMTGYASSSSEHTTTAAVAAPFYNPDVSHRGAPLDCEKGNGFPSSRQAEEDDLCLFFLNKLSARTFWSEDSVAVGSRRERRRLFLPNWEDPSGIPNWHGNWPTTSWEETLADGDQAGATAAEMSGSTLTFLTGDSPRREGRRHKFPVQDRDMHVLEAAHYTTPTNKPTLDSPYDRERTVRQESFEAAAEAADSTFSTATHGEGLVLTPKEGPGLQQHQRENEWEFLSSEKQLLSQESASPRTVDKATLQSSTNTPPPPPTTDIISSLDNSNDWISQFVDELTATFPEHLVSALLTVRDEAPCPAAVAAAAAAAYPSNESLSEGAGNQPTPHR